MVECGSIFEPPSFRNITVWGIVTFICMLFIGGHSAYGMIEIFMGRYIFYFWVFLTLAEYGFGVAGLVFVILSIVRNSGANMKIGVGCYALSCGFAVAVFIYLLLRYGWYIDPLLRYLFHLAVCLFLTYIFFMQSKKLE